MSAAPRELAADLDYGYVDHVVRNIRSSLGITRDSQPIEPGPLLSIHLQSNRPDNFTTFLEELEASLDDPSRVEVVVKIDNTDTAMNELLPKLITKHSMVVKYISTPLVGGFFELWRSMNDMLKICHPHAYFLWNMNDEMAVVNKGWDSMLLKYVGLFPDHIFRLRTSLFRFRNYYDFWECGFAPETSAITTKRWIDICGDWNPCLGPDSFNQCVAFYFGYHDRFNKHKVLRDVPIHDILLTGEGAYIGLEGEKLWRRLRGATRAWFRLMSYPIQTDASRRSQKLIAHIWAHENIRGSFTVEDDMTRKRVIVRDELGTKWRDFAYGLSYLNVALGNLWRTTHYFYYGGGGAAARGRRFEGFCAFLALRYDMFEWFRTVYLWQAEMRRSIRRALSARFRSLVWPGFEVPKGPKRSLLLRAMSLMHRTTRALIVKGLNRGIRFHQSVYAFDRVQQSIDWQMIDRLLATVKWPAAFADRRRRAVLLKCLLLQHWYDFSDEALEIALGRDLAFQRFVGIPLNASLPPMSVIGEFRLLLRESGVEDMLYRKTNLLINQEDLPHRPFISNVA